MRGKATLLLIALTTLGAHAANAGIDKAGTTAANFLTIGAGADVLSMGGATLGFGSSLNAASWNAAALGGLRSTEYVFSHASLAGESPQEWIAAGGRLGAMRTRWGLTGLYQGDGTFEGRDALNNPTGDFSASSMALGLQFAQPISPFASLGVGAKYVSERLGDVTGGGMTFDFGMRMQAGPLGFGAAAQNAFGKMGYNGLLYDFPTNYGVGVAYTMPLTGLTFALDANFPTSYYSDVRGGFEWRWHDRLALRTGYRKEMGSADGEPLGGPTFGMGAGANGFWFDYGYLTGGDGGGGQHRMALTYHPGFMNGDMAEETHAEPKESAPKTPKAPKTSTPKTSSTKVSSSSISTPKPAKTAAPKTEAAAVAPTAAVAAPVAAATSVAAPTKADKKAPKPGSYAAAVRAAEQEAAAKAAAPATPAPTAPPSTPATTSVAPERTAPMAKVSPSASAGTATAQTPAPTNSTKPAASISAPTAAASAAKTPSTPVAAAAPTAATSTAKTPSAPVAAAAPTAAAKTPSAPVAAAAPTAAAKTPTAPAASAAKAPAGFTDAQTMGDVPVVATPTNAPAKPSAAEAQKAEPAKTAAPTAAKTEEAPAPKAETPPTSAEQKSEQVAAVVPTTAPATPAPAPAEPAVEKPAPAVEKPAAAPAAPVMAARPSAAPAASKKNKDEEESAPAGKRPDKAKLKSGESLADFAKRWNTTAAAIMMANNLVSEKVKPGTTLKLPPASK
jgi:LysM repeat protein